MIHFNSTSHQRFENGIPVRGMQKCNRFIEVEENINECQGYNLTDGDGYIVSILNLDGSHPLWGGNYQMSPKPMRLVSKASDSISLRGYEVLALTPFGYQEIDMSCYGITFFIDNGEISMCRLDMFDRNTYIEYYK